MPSLEWPDVSKPKFEVRLNHDNSVEVFSFIYTDRT